MSATIGSALKNRLFSTQDYELIEVNIFLRGEPTELMKTSTHLDTFRNYTPIEGLKQQTLEQQQSLLSFLDHRSGTDATLDNGASIPKVARAKTYWLTNAVSTWMTRDTLEAVVRRPDVLEIELVRHVDVSELLDAGRQTGPDRRKAPMPAAALESETHAPKLTWSVHRVGAPLLWQLGVVGQGVLVAVVDTGINYRHPDLVDRLWDGGSVHHHHGWDFDNDDDDPMDQAGHGTCCAGIVAGTGRLGLGTGVAPKATIMGLRVGGTENNFWDAFEFAIENKVQVVTMSMSWKYPSHPNYPGWRRSCETLLAAGILHSNSIGNQGDRLATHPIPYNVAAPGNCPPPRIHPLQEIVGGVSSAISCGATDDTDGLAIYSGRGPSAWEVWPHIDYPYQGGERTGLIKPDICAPGPGTRSCNWRYGLDAGASPYVDFGGTSSATPHIGGCLALLASACLAAGKPIVPANIQEALENTAAHIAGQSKPKENHYGAGRVDVYAAYNYGRSRAWW